MSEWNQPDDFDDLEEGEEGKGKNPVRDRMRKLEKENKELRETNAKLSSQTRKTSVERLLADAHVKHASKVAGLVPGDVEATAEGVKQWLDTYADVFSIETEDDAGEGGDSDGEPTPEQVEQAQKMGRIGKATASNTTPTKQADLAKRLADPKLTREELLGMIEEAGGGFGSG
jgi:hypothetical protein